MTPQPIYICGPTASGKSQYALKLAEEIDGEIINADPYQAYQGLETLSAAPPLSEQKEIPHHLYSTLERTLTLNASEFRTLALPVIEEVQARGKTPLIVGGSGLYLKFLTHGPSPLPAGNPELRNTLEALETKELVAELDERDPEELERLGPHNRRYLVRAVEIARLSETKPSILRKKWEETPSGLQGTFLQWPRETLRERIAQRTQHMLQKGAIEEVAQLPQEATTAAKAIGVTEIRKHLKGELTLEECTHSIIIATRHYAKRQETWFRKEKWLETIEMKNA